MINRKVTIKRETKETTIKLKLNLDGKRKYSINTGIGFLDHMLELLAFHASLDLELSCQGDLVVDEHHSIEDIAITLGQGITKALGEKKGICRYAFKYLPMDECLTRTCIDLSGRFYHHFNAKFDNSFVGLFPVQMVEHFFYSLAFNSSITLHQELLYGSNDHHKIESFFKGFALAFREAVTINEKIVLSSKGII